jgi:RHS repeat-associated protein
MKSGADRKNQTTTFTYDPLNRRTQASYVDSAVATFTYDAAGRLTQADDTADPHRPIARTYDPLDRLLTETTSLGTVSYAYDTAGRRTSMTVGGQAPVSYTYDHNSRLRTITEAPLNPVAIQYDAASRRTLLTLPNSVSTEYQYDLGSRLTALIYRNASGPLRDLTYQYDPAGNRIGVGGSFARTLLPDAVPSATHDQGNRQLAFGPKIMTFDDNGNLLTQTDPSGTITYTWDARNRLLTMAGPSVDASFAYDSLGRRARKTVSSVTTDFQYDGLDVLRETSAGGDASYLRTFNIDEALVRADAVDTVYYISDALGSSVALTNAAGTAAATYTYEPFGRTEVAGTPSPNAFQFTGRENDGAGLYYYRARYYQPALGRFVSEDPIQYEGGQNLYTYVDNDPMSFSDPGGYTKGGQQKLNINLPDGRTITKKTPAQQIQEVLKKAKDLGLSPETIKKLKGLHKVVKRGGTVGILIDLIDVDEANAGEEEMLEQCLERPDACRYDWSPYEVPSSKSKSSR